MRYLPVVLTVVLSLVGSAAPCQSPVEEREAFSVLQYRTGWVFLGLVSVETGRLAPDADGNTYYFTIVGREPGGPESGLPKIGDRIRATSTWRMVILDFGKSGEKNRLASPTTRKQLSPSDKTNLAVREGTVVEVRDVQLSKTYGGPAKMLWARVSPCPN
jgi:hypothetical protein